TPSTRPKAAPWLQCQPAGEYRGLKYQCSLGCNTCGIVTKIYRVATLIEDIAKSLKHGVQSFTLSIA
ncbi:hypothetical protein, partial [Rhodovulum strictum]